MAWTGAKSRVLAGIVGGVVIGAVVAVKLAFFPSIKEDYFAMNQRSLRAVPFGLVVVRPTHFPKSAHKGVMWGSAPRLGKPVWRMLGRNVSLPELIGAAYGKNADRVVLPVTAPHTNYDFLVTATRNQQQQLQRAIRNKLGLDARTEMRDTAVLALKAPDPSQLHLAPSDAHAAQNVKFDNGRLQFTHIQMGELLQGLEQVTKLPVTDKTGLTNYYDFSIAWGPQVETRLRNEATAQAVVNKIVNDLGLVMEPDEDRTEMLVVRNAR